MKHNGFRGYNQKSQWRSALYFSNEKQREEIKEKLRDMMKTVEPGGKLFVDVQPIGAFYRAEEHHQDAILKSRVKLMEQARRHAAEAKLEAENNSSP